MTTAADRYPLRSGQFTTPGKHRVTMQYRDNTNDWNTLWASLNEDEYRLPTGLRGKAVDVGGYLGSVGIALAMDNPDLRVTIIEPVPGNLDLIRENVVGNMLADRVHVQPGAVGGEDDHLVTVWYGYKGNEAAEHHAFVGNSSLAYDDAGELAHEEVTYPATRLSDLVKDGPLAFLKVDCEGGEWAFLRSPALLAVEWIVGEWHPVRGHTVGDMLQLLDPTHLVTFSGPQEGPGGFSARRRAS